MLIRSYIRFGSLGRLLFSLVAGWLTTMASPGQAQTTLNVTNFGAVGDAVHFFVTTTSNSVLVTTTNQLSSADIGKAIEVFGAGAVTTPPYCQDMLGTITNVVNSTNIYISQIAQATLTNTFALYGHDNHTNFQNAVNACAGDSNDTINIPAGHYFLSCPYQSSDALYAGVVLKGGGLHFVGAGTNVTILTSQGAWLLQSGNCTRGALFDIYVPITNDYPVSFGNMTFDGGVSNGLTSNQGYPASATTGQGWDGTHHAIAHVGGYGANFTSELWTNMLFTHWRGEMVISTDGSTNGNLSIFNCAFVDGNATAMNVYQSQIVSNCLFSGLYETFEFYQSQYTNTSFFENNLITNITGGGCAFNGALTNKLIPTYNVFNNVWYLPAGNGIQTTPGCNINITGNTFYNAATTIALGVSGYQGTFINSNIVVTFNTFSNCFYGIGIEGGGQNEVADVQVVSNTFYGSGGSSSFATGYGWSTNVSFANNLISGVNYAFYSASLGGQWFLDSLSDTYTPVQSTGAANTTNALSYAYGAQQITWSQYTTATYQIDDSSPAQIPTGAEMTVSNLTSSSTVSLLTSSTRSVTPISMTGGYSAIFRWTNGAWMNISNATNATAMIQVTPGIIAYGTLLSGTSKTNSFTVQNVGSGTLSGTASVGAPFSILSGGSYSLGSNQSQTVTVVFSPAAASNYNQSVTFTGGAGTNATVSGSATNAPVLNPTIKVTPGSIAYGTILSGTSKTNSFTVQNVGTGTLSGTASVGAPFSIVSGGNYSLGSNQSQTVTVSFSPTVASNYNQSVTFTGGNGTNATVAGAATNVPPTVSAISANVPDVDTNMAGFQIYVGTTVQLSATASAPNGDALTWQWLYSTNGGSQIVYQTGSGTAPTNSFTYPFGTAGSTYVWTLQVTDSQTQLSAQSQLTLSVVLKPPQGLTIMPN